MIKKIYQNFFSKKKFSKNDEINKRDIIKNKI